MKIHISETTKAFLDKMDGFRCDYRGVFDLGVSLFVHTYCLLLVLLLSLFKTTTFIFGHNSFSFNILGKTRPNGDVLVDWKGQRRRGE